MLARWSSSPPGWRLPTIFGGIGISQTSRPTRLWRLHPNCRKGSFPSDQQLLCSNLHKHPGSLVQALLRIAGWHVRYFRISCPNTKGGGGRSFAWWFTLNQKSFRWWPFVFFFQHIFFWIFPFDIPQKTPKTHAKKTTNTQHLPRSSILHNLAHPSSTPFGTPRYLKPSDDSRPWTWRKTSAWCGRRSNFGWFFVGLRVGHCRKEPKEIAEEKGRFFS